MWRYLNSLRRMPMKSIRILYHGFSKRYWGIVHRKAPIYCNPSEIELQRIEADLVSVGIKPVSFVIDEKEFREFDLEFNFPPNFYGGKTGLRDEKVFEHFVAYKFLDLARFRKNDTYVDIAGAASPWVDILRSKGYTAFSIDLEVPNQFVCNHGYKKMDATNTDFDNSSISGCSMQCAFEMFIGKSDCKLIKEAGRFLKPHGKLVISPLYMHTHHCGYSSPEYYKRGFADDGCIQYINRNCWDIPFSRKYSAELLRDRIIVLASENGFSHTLWVIRNKKELGNNIYCHFVLVLTKN